MEDDELDALPGWEDHAFGVCRQVLERLIREVEGGGFPEEGIKRRRDDRS